MSRLPIRLRLTLAFALAMAVVLGATGSFLYLRLGATLSRTIDQGLRTRAADVTALVQQSDSGLGEAKPRQGRADGFAQVLDARWRVVDATAGERLHPLLSRAELARALARPLFLKISGEEARLFAEPVSAQGQRLVVVVGTSLEPRAEALAGLRTQLLVGGPLALLLASFGGYGLAAGALRPVEAMRKRAQAVSASGELDRLPVSPAGDEIGRLGQTLNEMLERLQLALERERTFVSDASHELRSPLALIKTEIELALEKPRPNRELNAALASIGEETDRLAQIADDLLLLARADSGRLALRRVPVDVRALLTGVVRRFRQRAQQTGRRIEVRAPAACTINADPVRVEQALSNLVENALRYGSGAVRLEAIEANGQVELHVLDEGQGFPPPFLEHAFERFARADEVRARGGTGLGLAIVAAIAAAHGGRADVRNGGSGGADVSVTVPRAPWATPRSGP